MLATRQQQSWRKPAHVAPAIEHRSCVGIAPGRANSARQEMNMQCMVAGRDKHLELVKTHRSAPSVEALKWTDTKHEHATSPGRPMSRCGACGDKLPHGHWRCGRLTSDVAKSHNHGRPCLVGFCHRSKALLLPLDGYSCVVNGMPTSNQPSASASARAFLLHLRSGRIVRSRKCGVAAHGCAHSGCSRTCLEL